MSIEVRIDRNRGCVVVRASGALRDGDVAYLVNALRRTPKAEALDALYDYRDVTDVSELSTDVVRQLGEIQSCDPGVAQRKRVAIVASTDALFGLGRMFALGSDERLPGVEVFRELGPALLHLGLDTEQEALA